MEEGRRKEDERKPEVDMIIHSLCCFRNMKRCLHPASVHARVCVCVLVFGSYPWCVAGHALILKSVRGFFCKEIKFVVDVFCFFFLISPSWKKKILLQISSTAVTIG